MIAFNLVDEPWIPVLLPDGTTQSLGLADTFARASEIREIADPSPLNVVGLHRLLLAITHRVFGPSSMVAWSKLWDRGAFDQAAIVSYLSEWRVRFDLFDAARPFYQLGTLDIGDAGPIADIAHELAGKAGADLFNHGLDDANAMSAAKAARMLIAQHCFAMGGTISLQKTESPALFKFARTAPLTKGAVVTVKGLSLFETLLLNLHWYSEKNQQPFRMTGSDRPAWESDVPATVEERVPYGYLDLLTWQSRRIRLFPQPKSNGNITVAHAVIMKGCQFPSSYTRHGHETMLMFRAAKDAKPDQDPWPAISLREDRALWRDSLSLIESVSGETSRPRLVEWLSDLAAAGFVSVSKSIPLDVAGLAVHPTQAKVFLWRHERLPLPLIYLSNKRLVDELRSSLALAERIGTATRSSVWLLANRLAAPNSDQKGARKADPKDVQNIVKNLAIERVYWSRLDFAFRTLLEALPVDLDNEGQYGVTQRPVWANVLRRTAMEAFGIVTRSLDASARSLKAVAEADRALRRSVYEALLSYSPQQVQQEKNE